MNKNVDSKAELYGGDCVQDARDPFILPRYRVSSGIVGMSEHAQIDEEHQTFESGRFGQRR